VNPLPVDETKICGPYLREDTLSRPRLNGWLDRAARGRLAVVIGDAGFGKSTLLSDWSMQSRRLTAWYRLERDDRDWLTFIRHLVAGGREVDAGFAPETYRLLCRLGMGGPTQAELMESLAREMAAFGNASPHGFSVILDDYDAVERSEETDPIVAALLEATGPGFSLIVASRTDPFLPPVKLRGRRAVARLPEVELRFTREETEALFGDAYGIPLESDVARDLARRTEGWAALLSLVRTRLEEQPNPDPRALVAQLSATKGDLYDYLAEEVLVDLPPELHDFLMRISILLEITPTSVGLLHPGLEEETQQSLRTAERLGFLSRAGTESRHRFNPLVRELLAARLEAAVGVEEFRRQNRLLAEAYEKSDWRMSASHYRTAADPEAAARVIDRAVPEIIASGTFEAAASFLDGTAGATDRVGALILRSRIEFARGSFDRAIALARGAVVDGAGELAGTAQLNIAALEGIAGVPDDFEERVEFALRGGLEDAERRVAAAARLVRDAQADGDLAEIADALRELANQQELGGLARYASISRINLANVLIWLGDPREALRAAVQAETALSEGSGVERVAALTARATALVHLGKMDEADLVLGAAAGSTSVLGRIEAYVERAMLEASYGSLPHAQTSLERIDLESLPRAYLGFWELASGLISLRIGDVAAARNHSAKCRSTRVRDVAGKFRTDLLVARVDLASGQLAEEDLAHLTRLAGSLNSRPARALAAIMNAASRPGRIGTEVSALSSDDRHVLSVVAEELSTRLHDLSSSAYALVQAEAASRPQRWATALRLAVTGGGPSMDAAAVLLSQIGDTGDASFLRAHARTTKGVRDAASAAVRRLAPKGVLRDLGVVRLEVSGAVVGSSRRKAMALLCFLVTRPKQAATKDEALEALWPDCSPEMGLNSLHQAIYYLRRIFDPDFKEGVSAGYLTFDGEVLTLDPQLVEAESGRCWRLLRSTTARDLEATEAILALYQSRFAIDFTYEEWSTDYRETLHAAVLSRVEESMRECLSTGQTGRAIAFGVALLATDSTADSIELELLRAYKVAGHIAAAREQYAHYAATMRTELGVDPMAFDAI
jgi:ATP/maltotriose-dependent transcriptional regulator MalT/DNA-binding SARP family transcriptional activator